MYDILITYDTGDSFQIYEDEQYLNIPVSTLEMAKENLKRIKKHNEEYEKRRRNTSMTQEIVFLTDKGTHTITWPFWQGFFERLRSAKVVIMDEDSELEFTV